MTFEVSRLFVGVFFSVVAGVAAAGTTAGCSSSSATATPAEGGNACPATIDVTLGAACSSEGVVCSPTFPCGFATVTIRCTCAQGAFQCIDGAGNALAVGDTPSCGDAGGSGSCPASESAALKASCTRAQSGQQCAYAPQCAGGTLAFDRCTCEESPTGSGFGYACENSCNSGTGPVPDAGSSSGGQDATPDVKSGDAASDAATE